MFTNSADADLEMALRDSLRHLPSPAVSADFDSRVLHALAQTPGWRVCLWHALRPMLTGAACSLTLMLLALFCVGHAPQAALPAAPPASPSRPLDTAALETLLNQPHLSAGVVIAWSRSAPPARQASVSPVPEQDMETPRRHASRLLQTALVA